MKTYRLDRRRSRRFSHAPRPDAAANGGRVSQLRDGRERLRCDPRAQRSRGAGDRHRRGLRRRARSTRNGGSRGGEAAGARRVRPPRREPADGRESILGARPDAGRDRIRGIRNPCGAVRQAAARRGQRDSRGGPRPVRRDRPPRRRAARRVAKGRRHSDALQHRHARHGGRRHGARRDLRPPRTGPCPEGLRRRNPPALAGRAAHDVGTDRARRRRDARLPTRWPRRCCATARFKRRSSAPTGSRPTATPRTRSAPTASRCSPSITACRSTSPRRRQRSTSRSTPEPTSPSKSARPKRSPNRSDAAPRRRAPPPGTRRST